MSEDGTTLVVPRARVAAAVLAAALCVALVGTTPARAGGGDLRDAREHLADLVSSIERRTAELATARDALSAADIRVNSAAGRLAAVTVLREELEFRLAEVQARLDAAQAELDAAAADLFMGAGASSSAGGVVSALLGAGSMAELGDRIEFASAGTTDAATLAARAQTARAELEARHEAADLLVGAEAVLLGSVRAARDELEAAVGAARDAMARLDAEREAAVALVERLAAEAGGLAAVDLSSLGHALRGADGVTYGEWAKLFLQMAGASTCRDNLVIMVAWQAAEGTQAAWNPLATTHPMPGATAFNGVGVRNFVSLRQGLQGTWETIENGWDVYGYGAIITSLRDCAPAMTTARAINASSWCPGCTNGMYVLNVVPHVQENLDTYLAI